MREGFWLWREDVKHKINTLVLSIFVLSTVAQTTIGFATPGYFARPGAGVSRLPLDVLAFGAPGFGEVEDAINLATGNVYIAADATSNNNLSGAGDDTTNRIGNGTWTYAPRLQLVGFVNTPVWTSANAPSSFFLGRGDGSGDTFFRFTPTNYTQVPSWVQRYQAHVTAGKAVLYALEGRNGLQYSQEWIVLVLTAQDGNIAHYYQQDGSRYSFFKKGQWPDFMQTPYEQFKASTGTSAAPDGIFNGVPTGNRTNFTYTNTTNGFIKQVDNLTFGRTTEYVWDTPNKKLTSIRYLLKTKTDNNTWARKVDFDYVTFGTNHYVKTVTFTAPDGKALNSTTQSLATRTVTFDYSPTQVPGKVVVTYIGREVLQGISASKKVEYFYRYDTSGRITHWRNNQDLGSSIEYQANQPTTGNTKVVVTHGQMDVTGTVGNEIWTLVPSLDNKVEEYYFNANSQLYKKRIKNRNGWVSANNWLWPLNPPPGFDPNNGIWLEWNYTYYGTGSSAPGSTASIINADGQKTEYFYDERANLSQINTWWTDQFGSYVYRTKYFKYDTDNRLIADIDWGDSAAFDDISYNYSTTKTTHEVTTYHQSTSSTRGMTTLPITIKVPNVVRHHRKLGGSNYDIDGTSQSYIQDTIDNQGRLTQSQQVAAGTDTVTTSYSYTAPTLNFPHFPDGLGNATLYTTLAWTQYLDQPFQKTISSGSGNSAVSRTIAYGYDAFGNVIYESATNDYVSGWASLTSPTFTTRTTQRAFNGFGQQIWERTLGGTTVEAHRYFDYAPTGELKASWEGTKDNETLYTYGLVAGDYNFARVTDKQVGVKGGLRNTAERYIYDVFGRTLERQRMKASSQAYEIVTSYTYDTLDRIATEQEPDGTTKGIRYHASGTPDVNCSGDYYTDPTNVTTNWYACKSDYIDPMGRVGYSYIDAGEYYFIEVTTTYDPKGNPLKITNTSLEMNNTGADQSTYFEYDSFGRLLKQSNPPLRTATGGGYTDSRRPLSLFNYDNLGRKSSESVSVGSSNQHAVTLYTYDGLDRTIQVQGPQLMTYTGLTGGVNTYSLVNANDSYITRNLYDGRGNLYKQVQQVCKASDTTCKTYSPGAVDSALTSSDTLYNSTLLTTRTTYDSQRRVTAAYDGNNVVSKKVYDLLGNVLAEVDGRNITTKTYQYRLDGILERVAEPTTTASPSTNANVQGTPKLFNGTTPPSGYTTTQEYIYLPGGTKPDRVNKPVGNNVSVTTFFDYDNMDRVVATHVGTSTGPTTTQRYDTRGNLMYLQDPEGFVTSYMYNGWNRLFSETKSPRPGTSDQVAWEFNGQSNPLTLQTLYAYDLAGNLTLQFKGTYFDNGLYTRYHYNSLGKVISESRPYMSGVTSTSKLKVYNQMGWLTGETTFDYQGSLRGSTDPSSFTTTNPPTTTTGNHILSDFNPRGEKTQEVSRGITPGSGGSAFGEYSKALVYNGLGQKIKRTFGGDVSIYAPQKYSDGSSAGNYYESYWKYDINGNVVEAFDLTLGEALSNASKQNWYTYSYSPTNKVLQQDHTVKDMIRSTMTTQHVDVANGIQLGGSNATITTTYNERDLLHSTTVIDKSPTTPGGTFGREERRKTDYTYYGDGSRKMATVSKWLTPSNVWSSVGTNNIAEYDNRGRITKVQDSNGRDLPYNFEPNSIGRNEPLTTTTSYSSTGVVTETVTRDSAPTVCIYKRETTPTVGGLTYKEQNWDLVAKSNLSYSCGAAQGTNNTTTQFNTWGKPTRVSQLSSEFPPSSPPTSSPITTLTYNVYGDNTESKTTVQENIDVRRCGSVDCDWEPGILETITTITKSYNDANGAQNQQSSQTTRRAFALSDGQTTIGLTTLSSQVLAYALDSRANRLKVTVTSGTGGGQNYLYNNYEKRYDAENRVASFYRSESQSRGLIGWANGTARHFVDFRYDPFNNQVLSINSTVWESIENATSMGSQYEIYRKVYTNLGVGADVEAIRLRIGLQAKYTNGPNDTWSETGWTCGGYNNCTKLDILKDETYGLWDGLIHEPWTIVKPFFIQKSAQALQAPTAPFSVQAKVTTGNLGVLDVKPPSAQDTTPPSSTPTQPGNGEVKPPAAGTHDQGQATKVNEQETKQNNNFSVGGSGTLSALPNLDNKQTNQGTAEANNKEEFGLKPPSSVLPPTMQSMGVTGVQTPQAGNANDTNPLPGNTGKPDEVKQPDQTPTPGVGTTPNDTPGTIKSPETSGLLPPSIPKIDPLTQQPITVVQAPVGWQPGGVSSQDVDAFNHPSPCVGTTPADNCESLPAYKQWLQETADEKKREQERALGDQKKADQLTNDLKEKFNRSNLPPEIKIQLKDILDKLEGRDRNTRPIFDPAEQVAFLVLLDTAVVASRGNHRVLLEGLRAVDDALNHTISIKNSSTPMTESGVRARNEAVEAMKATAFSILGGIVYSNSNEALALQRDLALGIAGVAGLPLSIGDVVLMFGPKFALRGLQAINDYLARPIAGFVKGIVGGCRWLAKVNSFSPDTKVATAKGLVAIASLTIGTHVLAFNEKTGKNEYQPILEVFKNQDPEITFLTLKDDETNREEFITTTPGHPFYLQKNVDSSQRPAPKGHEDLKQPWVGAGDLKQGDKVRQSDGTTGTVVIVKTVQETRTMYNLTVDTAHTFYVGEGQWLVHNTNGCLTQWGYTGTKEYNKVVDQIRTNTGTLEEVGGIIPTRQEAEKLIAEAGGKVLRVERGHPSPNPHDYPHINYTIDGKNVITIRVEGVGRQYYAPNQKGYGQ